MHSDKNLKRKKKEGRKTNTTDPCTNNEQMWFKQKQMYPLLYLVLRELRTTQFHRTTWT